MDKVAVIGVAQTRHEASKPHQTYADLVYEVVQAALADAGLSIADIDNVVTVSNDLWDGRTISSMAVMDSCGAYGKNVSTVEGDGTLGGVYGVMRTLSGSYDTTLVIAHGKGSEARANLIGNARFDPIYYRNLGLDDTTAAALQARRYYEKYGVKEEQAALVVRKNLANARLNPNAHRSGDFSVDEIMSSHPLAEPIKAMEVAPNSDGACAIILATDRAAGRSRQKPVWIQGVGYGTDAYFLGDRDLAEVDALKAAAARAYSMAGVSDPRREINVFEVFDAYSYQELLWLEGLGLCERGQAGRLAEDGLTQLGGRFPVNPSGGVLSANPPVAAGLVRVVESVLQVRGQAGSYQVDGVKTALAHGTDGLCGQIHCVWILGE